MVGYTDTAATMSNYDCTGSTCSSTFEDYYQSPVVYVTVAVGETTSTAPAYITEPTTCGQIRVRTRTLIIKRELPPPEVEEEALPPKVVWEKVFKIKSKVNESRKVYYYKPILHRRMMLSKSGWLPRRDRHMRKGH